MAAVARGAVRPRPDVEGAASCASLSTMAIVITNAPLRTSVLCSSNVVKSSASCGQTRRRGSRSIFPMPALDLLGGSEVSMARRYRLLPLLLRAIGAPLRAGRSLCGAPGARPTLTPRSASGASVTLCVAPMTLRDELYAWLASQDAWQQDLAKRLAGRAQLDGPAYDEALRMLKTAFGALSEGETARDPQPLALDDLPAQGTPAGTPRLVSFGRLRGVGAVSSEHELHFAADGLTVIYGQNAAGKTTYVRALKRVCRTVDCEAEVRGNVFAAPSAPATSPTANVELQLAGQSHAQQIALVDPPDLGLDAISVFDARCAELYIDAQNSVAYVPSTLLLLARLAATQDQMRGDIQTEVQRLSREAPTFPEFDCPSVVKNFLDGLAATTRPDDARRLASLSAEEHRRLTELRAAVTSTAARSVRADAEAAHQDATQARTLTGQLRRMSEPLERAAVEALRARESEADTAEQAVGLAAREFAGVAVSGVGSEPWRRLWQAAREFNERAGAGFPPDVGTHCPLCLQEITADAAARLAHFEQHVHGAVGEQAGRARKALEAALDPLDERHVDALRTPFFAGLAAREAELHGELERLLDLIRGRMRVLREDPAGAQVMPVSLDTAAKLETWAATREAHAQTLDSAEDPERERELRQELAELEAREKLSERLDDVTSAIRTLKRVAALRLAHSALATNRITIKQREFSDAVVEGTLDAKLKEELRNLRCEHLPVDLHPNTAVGETQVALRLAGAHGAPRVSDIASEGEQRALSLSFFLAEVATSENDGGIVVDDPVSSLDDERRAYIAERLVAEARRRQVIVLTHDLPFMLDLVDLAEKAGIELAMQGVWRLGSEVGRVDDHPPFKAMKLRQRIGVLDQEVARWDNQAAPRDFDEAWRRVCDFYSRVRITWERAVEERLFRGVVQRFQREVKTMALDDVVVAPHLVTSVKEGMTRCSQFVHDEPQGATTTLPRRADLDADLAKLQEFERQTRL